MIESGKPGPRVQIVYRALKRAILDRALPPGSKLPEDSIGEPFGVSRTLVREALVRLREEELVEMRANKGATVANPSLEDGQKIFAVRFALERIVVECLSGQVTSQQQKVLMQQIAAENEARRHDPNASTRLAGEFHTLLASMTGNAMLTRYVNEVVVRSSLVLALYGQPHSAEGALNEHAEIVSLLVAGDGVRVVELMHHHLEAITVGALLPDGKTGDMFDILSGYAVSEGLLPQGASSDLKSPSRAAGQTI